MPDQVKENLPQHGQEIFKEAFNSAEKEYKDEEAHFKVAWNAVKNVYYKNQKGDWVKKD
nr:ChaB family protein [Metabacillus lacus]